MSTQPTVHPTSACPARRPLRVLFFIDRMRHGGIQALAYDILQHNDEGLLDIELLNLDDGQQYPLTQTLRDMGVTVHQLKGAWLWSPLDIPHYRRAVRAFFEAHHDYDVVHMHSSSKNYYILQCAAQWGIPVRVAHSHNTGFQSHNPLTVMMGNLMKRPMMKYATHLVGCSEMACQWLFGADSVQTGRAQVILNGIYSPHFVYDAGVRRDVRRELGLEGKFVIGHVGRFEAQKNHTFLLDIFAEVARRRADAHLLLVGIGSLMEAMRDKARQLGLESHVTFLGFRDDAGRIMQGMDSFLFPSLHEGLSVVLIEAQASGMPVFVSDSTTTEVSYSPHICFLSLSMPAAQWAEAIVQTGAVDRQDMTTRIEEAGFDIRSMIRALYRLYTSAPKTDGAGEITPPRTQYKLPDTADRPEPDTRL